MTHPVLISPVHSQVIAKYFSKIEIQNQYMLSRKQTWRKIRSKSGEAIFTFCDKAAVDVVDFDSVLNDEANSREGTGSPTSTAATGAVTPSPIKKLRSALSMGDLSKALRRNEDSRNLRFSSKVHVCLIPTRQDLFSVAKDVFWHSDDYQTFKREAVDELRTYLQLKGITAKEAIQALYQPQPEEFSFLRSLHVNNDTAENGLSRSDSSPAVMEMASSSNMADTSSTSSSHLHMNADTNACEDDSMELSVSDDLNSGDVNESNLVDPNNNNKSSNNNTISQSNDIKLGFKTDLDMNKELGTIKTPARQGGANSGAWAVQWQAPMSAM